MKCKSNIIKTFEVHLYSYFVHEFFYHRKYLNSIDKLDPPAGCKWTLKQLRRHLKCSDCNDWLLWQKVNILVTLTLMSQVAKFPEVLATHQQYANNVPPSKIGTTFELYGFDILVTSSFQPSKRSVTNMYSPTYVQIILCKISRTKNISHKHDK